MKDTYDLMTGLSYVALTSRKREEKPVREKHSTLGEGLAIVGSFILSMALIVIVM